MLSSRRAFLKLASGGLATATLPANLWADTDSSENLHAEVARIAAQLAKSRRTRLLVLYPDGCQANLQPVARLFNELTGIEVNLKKGSLDEISAELILNEKLRTNKFDVAIPATFGMPDLIDSDSIFDLSEFAERYQPSSFEPSLYQHGDHFATRLYGYQTDGDCYLMFYNRDFLEDEQSQKRYEDMFGEALRVPKTWQALDRQLAFFHQPEQDRFGGSLFRNRNYTAWEFWVRLHAKGVLPFGDNMQCQLTKNEGVEALQELADASAFLEPGVLQNGLFENFRSFARGNKYCNIGWGGTQKYLNGPQSAVKNRLVYTALPGGIPGLEEPWLPFFNWGWNFVVPRSSEQAELAYLFCLFASTSVPSTLSVRESEGYFDPFRIEHYDDPQIRKTYSQDFLNTHYYSMSNAFPDLYIRGRGLYFDVLRQAVFACGSGMTSAEPILKSVAEAWEKITDELGRDQQRRQWSYLKEQVYPSRLHSVLA